MISLVLVVSILFLVAANVVYQISAVELMHIRTLDRWSEQVESEFGYTSCLVLDDSTRIIRILTLRCRSGSLKYVHVAEGNTLLGESDVDAFDFSMLRMWAQNTYGVESKISVTFYQNKTVLRILSERREILVDPKTNEELWKVNFDDE